MSPENFKNIAESVQAILTSLAISVGGGWTFWKFVLNRENRPKVSFELNVLKIGEVQDKLIIEIVATIENKSTVRHWISDFTFDVFYLKTEDDLNFEPEDGYGKIRFKKINELKTNWISKKWSGSFIDPGIRQAYTYLYYVPTGTRMVTVSSEFKYNNRENDRHTARGTFNLEKMEIKT
jgi:hypothetical protein